MRRVPLSQAFQKTTLEVLYQGTPESFVLNTSVSASDSIYPGMVMQIQPDGTVALSNGGGFLGLSGLYKTTDIDDEAPTGHFAVWTEGGRYIIYSPAFNTTTNESWTMPTDGTSKYLYATASGVQKGKLQPLATPGSLKPVAILIKKTTTSIEIELLKSA